VLDLAQCRGWRSETLAALASRPEFEEQRSRYATLRTNELAHLLADFDRKMSEKELRDSIWNSMVKPSIELAHELQLAPNIFTVEWTRFDNYDENMKERPNFGSLTCVNLVEYGKVIKPSSDHTGRSITYLFDICPGLYCQNVENNDSSAQRILCKPTVLVAATDGSKNPLRTGLTLLEWLRKGVPRCMLYILSYFQYQ